MKRVLDNDADYVQPHPDMLAGAVRRTTRRWPTSLREAHDVCDDHDDFATTSLIENWIDETERRGWFLFESTRRRN